MRPIPGVVNASEFQLLAENWLDENPSADIAPWPLGDQDVDILDLELLIQSWLEKAYWTE